MPAGQQVNSFEVIKGSLVSRKGLNIFNVLYGMLESF